MSVTVMALVYKARLLCPLRKAVALKLADCSDDEGQNIWPAVATIAAQAEISERSVQIKLRDLVGAGLLSVVSAGGGRHQSTTYAFSMPALYDLASGRRVASDAGEQFAIVDAPPQEASAENPAAPAPFPDQQNGAAPAPFLDQNPAGDSRNPAGDSRNPAGAAPNPSLPILNHPSPLPPAGGKGGAGKAETGFAKGWSPSAIEAVAEIDGSVTGAHVGGFIRAVCGTHNPPRGMDGPAFVRQLLAKLAAFPAEVLATVAERQIEARKYDLSPVADLVALARAEAAKHGLAAANATAEASTAGDPALVARWPELRAALTAELGAPVVGSWFGGAVPTGLDDGRLTLAVPDRARRAYVAQNYSDRTLAAFRQVLPSLNRVDFVGATP